MIRKVLPIPVAVLLALCCFCATLIVLTEIGFYTVQPIGALPEGVTAIVRRAPGEPFFSSPDAMCLKVQGYVSLMCRSAALAAAPVDRIVVRLPHMEWAYLVSTGGKTFEQ